MLIKRTPASEYPDKGGRIKNAPRAIVQAEAIRFLVGVVQRGGRVTFTLGAKR